MADAGDRVDLDELTALAKAATPGPWLQPIQDEPRLVSGPDGAESLLGCTKDSEAIVWSESDAALIVAMRNSLDALLAELRAHREREAARSVCWHCKVCLEPEPLPHCDSCPNECDDDACSDDGCREQRAANLGLVPRAAMLPAPPAAKEPTP